jgi:hypothetical protein
MKNIPETFKNRFSWKLTKTALWYLVISSIGPWAIGGVMATLGPESIWYKSSIYFYLHFQYNGWFILALLGILFFVLEENGIGFNPEKFRSFYLLLNGGVLLTVFLSFLWFVPPTAIYILGLIGVVAQLLAFYELWSLLKDHFFVLKKIFPAACVFLFKTALVLLAAKLFMQFFSAFPYVARLAFLLKDFVIGYLHLVFLGIVIPVLLVFLNYFKLVTIPKSFLWLFYFAFFTTEILIFYKAIAVWLGLPFFEEYYVLLAFLSVAFPIAVAILFFKNLKSAYLSAGVAEN